MLTWSPVLHFYQPPTQKDSITKQVTKSSYIPFLKRLLDHPDLKLTANISGSLILQLDSIGENEFFELVKELVKKEQLEFVNSPLYHPLMPLSPSEVYLRQLEYNRGVIEYFMQTSPINVIYPPELAVTQEVLSKLSTLKSNILVDSSATKLSENKSALIQTSTRKLIVSSREVTNVLRAYPRVLSPNKFADWLANISKSNLIISVSDVEIFGHHYTERLEFLFDVHKHPNVAIQPLSQILSNNKFEKLETDISPSSWVSGEVYSPDANNPFSLWKNNNNELQQLYWQLANLTYSHFSSVVKPVEDTDLKYSSAEKHLDKGLSSCHTYWLSNWPWWNPEIVEKGAVELIRAVRTLPIDNKHKVEAEELYATFIKKLWQYNWSSKPKEKYQEYERAYKKYLDTLPELEQL